MTINGSSFETFISKLKSEKPPSHKPGRSRINMNSQDSFDSLTTASTKGIDEHLSELLIASQGSKVQYLIPECYYTDPKLRTEFVQKLIKTEKPAAIHQYFSQLANKFPVNSVAFYNIMNAGLALQKKVCFTKIEKLQKQSLSLIHSPRQYFQERREVKKQLQRIENEQHKLSQALEKRPDNADFSELEGFPRIPEDVTTVCPQYSLQTTEPKIDLTYLKDELDSPLNRNSKTSSTEPLKPSPTQADDPLQPETALTRQNTGSFYSPLSNTFSRSDFHSSSRTSTTSIANELSNSTEQFPFLVENAEGGFSKLTLKRDSLASISDNEEFIPKITRPGSNESLEDQKSGVIDIGYKATPEELAKMHHQTLEPSSTSTGDQLLLPRIYQP